MGTMVYTVGIGFFIVGASAMDSADMRIPALMVACGIALAAFGYWLDWRR